MNIFSAGSWFWKALRGHSVTFAVLVAAGLLGVSVINTLKTGLAALGTPWLGVLLVPTLLIGLLAKKEKTWIPDEARRKFFARSLLGASALVAALLAWLRPEPVADVSARENGAAVSTSTPSPTSSPAAPIRPRGPSGK